MSKGICIWAHSVCPSTSSLYLEVVRQSWIPVRVAVWKDTPNKRVEQGFDMLSTGGIRYEPVGDNWEVANRILAETEGWIHVVCAYQASKTNQHVMRVVQGRGDPVVVYSESPCEMCIGIKAWLKRAYYRLVLPVKLRPLVKCADLILSQSGRLGLDRLMRLGWHREKIVPFGYVTDKIGKREQGAENRKTGGCPFRVLHLGSEAAYRGVWVVERAVERLQCRGHGIELVKTGGRLTQTELVREIRSADIVVGCGLCEPWGMRINDAIMEGIPVIVSDGMGVEWLVEKFGCGCVVPKGDVWALANVLERCAKDRPFVERLRSGAERAASEWTPEKRAGELLRILREVEER